MSIWMTRPFVVSYDGQFCIVCGHEVSEGDLGCFYGNEMAHYGCADEDPNRSDYLKQYTFDPKEWNL